MTPPPDHQFVRHMVHDERALLRFVLRYVSSLEDARDIVQDTMVLLWERRADYDEARPFLPWACTFARYKSLEFLRRNSRWQPLADENLLELLDRRRAELESSLDHRSEWLQQCIEKLTAAQRALITGHYFDELPVNELAERVGKSVDAVYKSMQRLRRVLFDCVSRHIQMEKEKVI